MAHAHALPYGGAWPKFLRETATSHPIIRRSAGLPRTLSPWAEVDSIWHPLSESPSHHPPIKIILLGPALLPCSRSPSPSAHNGWRRSVCSRPSQGPCWEIWLGTSSLRPPALLTLPAPQAGLIHNGRVFLIAIFASLGGLYVLLLVLPSPLTRRPGYMVNRNLCL